MYATARISLLYLFYVCLHSYGNMSERRDGGVRVRRGRRGSGAWKGEGTNAVASAAASAVAGRSGRRSECGREGKREGRRRRWGRSE